VRLAGSEGNGRKGIAEEESLPLYLVFVGKEFSSASAENLEEKAGGSAINDWRTGSSEEAGPE